MNRPLRCVVLGAAGRDFHDVQTFFRARPDWRVVAITAAQIPFIERRRFPRELAGEHYDEDIPIVLESELPAMLARGDVDMVALCYSDLSHAEVMHKASVALAHGAALPPVVTVAAAGLIGFLGYGLSLVLFVLALRHLGSARTGAYFSTAPFIGAALAVPMFGDPVTLQLLAAAVLMAFGVWLHLSERHDHEHKHEPTEHDHWHDHADPHHQHDHAPGDPPGPRHSHRHRHGRLTHSHPHYPDLHHRHEH